MGIPVRFPVARGLLVAAAFVVLSSVIAGDDVRTVTIFEGRQIAVAVPSGWKFDEVLDPHHGSPTVHIQDPQGDVAVVVAFFPDPRSRPEDREHLEADARNLFQPYLETSVEKDVDLIYFDAPDGAGDYASFTDGELDPRSVSDAEKLVSTAGLRSMKGVYVLFTVLTSSRESAAYRRALDLVRGELRQVKTPASF
ncbi:MAG: hypothetical protein ACM3NW_03980 [Syntrophomonadaceae bacterium]